jgi:trimeric autotransporter adhesin
MHRLPLLSLCFFVCLFSALAYSQATPPSGDTMSYSGSPTENYGSYTSLFVQTGSVISNSYIQFNLATVPTGSTVTKATLRLFVNTVTTAGSFDVYQLNNSWTESTLTYDNAPPLGQSATGGNPTAFTSSSLNQFILINITSLVQQWVNGSLTNNGLALAITTSSGALAFDSKEATLTSHQPELEIVLASAGGVTSWNSRTGAVLPQSGDYSFSLLSGTLESSQLSGTYSSALTLSNPSNVIDGIFSGNGAELSDVPVSSGSSYYIQNGTSQQASSNFNISGNGTAAGTLSGTIAVNTGGTYKVNGATVLNAPNNSNGNTFLGRDSGTSNTGTFNTFLGAQAGNANLAASYNSFLGYCAGCALTSGNNNTLVGYEAGSQITSSGSNTFLGALAGQSETTGGDNIFVGYEAGYYTSTNSNDIYIGNQGPQSGPENNIIRIGTQGTGPGEQNTVYIAGITGTTVSGGSPVFVNSNGQLGVGASGNSGVTSFNGRTGAVVPASGDYSFSLLSGTLGSSQLTGTYSDAVTLSNASNSLTGSGAGLTNVPVISGSTYYIQNGSSQQSSSNFNISGNGTAAGTLTGVTAVNTSGTYQIGGSNVLSAGSTGTSVGLLAGAATGNENTFVGSQAGHVNGGSENTFVGTDAGIVNRGIDNTFVGAAAGLGNENGEENVLVGTYAGQASTTGSGNTYLGYSAGTNATGSYNTLIGFDAGLTLVSGVDNIFIGPLAGYSETTGSHNVFIGYEVGSSTGTNSNDIYIGQTLGEMDENNTIRIGVQGTGAGEQNTTYIAGIHDSTSSGGTEVFVNSSGKLGISTSSRRFKDDILDMGDASSKLFQLRPVTFFYKPQYDDGSHILQYGLIAEEVAKVYPDLVVYGTDGQPQAVRYHLLTPMLLNELQKQNKVVSAQQDIIKTQQDVMQTQQQQIADLQQRLSRLESVVQSISEASLRK